MREADLQKHLMRESSCDAIHPDGCYYCGGMHPTSDCRDPEKEKDEKD